jgi:predicted enzyme related to lactoylglutathione lyase
MLGEKFAFSGFSVNDLAAAETFYRDTLGVTVESDAMGLHLKLQGGTEVFIYAKSDHQAASFTILNFVVDDIDTAVDQLTGRGVRVSRSSLPRTIKAMLPNTKGSVAPATCSAATVFSGANPTSTVPTPPIPISKKPMFAPLDLSREDIFSNEPASTQIPSSTKEAFMKPCSGEQTNSCPYSAQAELPISLMVLSRQLYGWFQAAATTTCTTKYCTPATQSQGPSSGYFSRSRCKRRMMSALAVH